MKVGVLCIKKEGVHFDTPPKLHTLLFYNQETFLLPIQTIHMIKITVTGLVSHIHHLTLTIITLNQKIILIQYI